jgi:hypothetical protein
MRTAVKWFRDICEQNRASGVIIDHTKRTVRNSFLRGDELMYGSTQKKAAFRAVHLIERSRDESRVRFSCVKMSESEHFQRFYISLTFDNPYSCVFAGAEESQTKRQSLTEANYDRIKAHLVIVSPERLSAGVLADALDIRQGSRAFSDPLRKAVADGSIKKHGAGKSTVYYYEPQDALDLDLPDPDSTADL